MFHVHELLTENSHHQTLFLPPVIISLFYYLSIIQILGFVNYSNSKKNDDENATEWEIDAEHWSTEHKAP